MAANRNANTNPLDMKLWVTQTDIDKIRNVSGNCRSPQNTHRSIASQGGLQGEALPFRQQASASQDRLACRWDRRFSRSCRIQYAGDRVGINQVLVAAKPNGRGQRRFAGTIRPRNHRQRGHTYRVAESSRNTVTCDSRGWSASKRTSNLRPSGNSCTIRPTSSTKTTG